MTPDLLEDRRQTVVAPPNNLPYIVAVVVMVGIGVLAVTMVAVLRPERDNGVLITNIIGFVVPTIAAVLAFMKSQETHLSVNSRLDAFMANAKMAAHAVGVNEGRAEGRQAANERTDTLAAAGEATTAKLLTGVEARADTLAAGARSRAAEPVRVEVVNTPLVVEDKSRG